MVPHSSVKEALMLATRPRFTIGWEWLTALVLLAATLIVAVLVVRELRVAPFALGTRTGSRSTAAAVPPQAVSVPTLVLGAHQIGVGDAAEQAAERLAAVNATVVGTIDEVGLLDRREVRTYQLGGTRFIVVVERFERGGPRRIAAIYLE
jgi:hypothetical protein